MPSSEKEVPQFLVVARRGVVDGRALEFVDAFAAREAAQCLSEEAEIGKRFDYQIDERAYRAEKDEIAKALIESDWDYSAWATGKLLEASAALTPAEMSRDLGISHSSILLTLYHILVSERFWSQCLTRNEIPALDEIGCEVLPQNPRLEEPIAEWPAIWNSVRLWLENLSDADLGQTLRCRFTAERVHHFTRWQLLRHSVNHATLHRGQIVGMLRMIGKHPANVDLMTYYQVR